jgi:hypothetical protein
MAKNFLEVSQMVEEKLKVPDSYDYSEWHMSAESEDMEAKGK